LPTTWYLCYQHVIPPSIPPERFYNFSPSVRFVSYSGYLQYEKNDLKLQYMFCQQHITVD
jgi:hypothetical protein